LSSENTVYVDATNQIAGRLSTRIAKLILTGKRVIVVNASHVNPIYGPIHPRRPDNILRRMVRGMVPRKKPKGAMAMRRLRVYIGVPEDFKSKKLVQFEDTKATRPVPVYVTMAELSKNLGWSGE